MSVKLRRTLNFLPSTTKLQVFSPVIIVFVCCLRNSQKPVTGTSLAAQMNDKCEWMSPECYPLIPQLAGVSLWSFLCRAVWKFLLNSFLFSFLLDKKLLYILFSREHIILSKLQRKRSIFKMNIIEERYNSWKKFGSVRQPEKNILERFMRSNELWSCRTFYLRESKLPSIIIDIDFCCCFH